MVLGVAHEIDENIGAMLADEVSGLEVVNAR